MAWSVGDKQPSKEGLARHGSRPMCRICGDSDCVCPTPEHNEHVRTLTQFVRDKPLQKCHISGDIDCVCIQNSRFCKETASPWVTSNSPGEPCPTCGDTDCVCPPFEDE